MWKQNGLKAEEVRNEVDMQSELACRSRTRTLALNVSHGEMLEDLPTGKSYLQTKNYLRGWICSERKMFS